MIWIVEKDYLLLKKYLESIYEDLPKNIPKLGLVTENGNEQRQKTTFKKYSLFDIINLNDQSSVEVKDAICSQCYYFLSNPQLGLTQEFILENKPQGLRLQDYLLLTVGVAGVSYLLYYVLSKKGKLERIN